MALASGTRFGSYVVAGQLGIGGMGEVYRATDTSLKRDVAIKILPPAFAEDADRVARFQREAEALAALNHSNIGQIYGLERSDGNTALVMELIDGPTLADRIAQAPIPPAEALDIAMQIVDALEAAHGQNIVHRDLKPANIKLKTDGTVKVLDFGIATAPESPTATSGRRSPALLTPALTEAGILLGTAAYMSPEQARGKPVDGRADIWAFGCVLYEMLTGQPAFGGEDVTTTLARVLERDTDFNALPLEVSPTVRHTIELCLEKDPRKRIADVRDLRLALQGAFDIGSPRDAEALPRTAPGRRWLVPASFAGMLVGGLIVALIMWTQRPNASPRPVTRFTQSMPDTSSLVLRRNSLAISPDGRRFVYGSRAGLYLRHMEQQSAELLQGTARTAVTNFAPETMPFFSPDGQWVAYADVRQGELERVAIGGGAPLEIARVKDIPSGLTWTADGRILYAQTDGLWGVAADGGAPELLVPIRPGEQLNGIQVLPDGNSVLTSVSDTTDRNDADIVVLSLESGERKSIGVKGSEARYLPTGHLLYAVGNGLFAAPFDTARLELTAGPVPVVDGVLRTDAAAQYAVSTEGTLIYASLLTPRLTQYTWFSRNGEPLGTVAQPFGALSGFELSPDDTRILDQRGSDDISIWVTDSNRNIASPLISPADLAGAEFRDPIWSPDGLRIAFMDATQERVLSIAASGGEPKPLFQLEGMVGVEDWSPDGRLILVDAMGAGVSMSVDGDESPVSLDRPANGFDEPHFSPDGKWVAYNADRSGDGVEVFVVPYPPTGERFQISSGGGAQARWRGDGRELFYLSPGGTMMAVDIDTESGFSASPPRALFETGVEVLSNDDQYAVASDGDRFLIPVPVDDDADIPPPAINIVLNWFEELARLAPTR